LTAVIRLRIQLRSLYEIRYHKKHAAFAILGGRETMPGTRRVSPRGRHSLLVAVLMLLALVRAGEASKREARGITVGPPRAFDNRALTLMLESLNASLTGLNVIDQKMLAQAIGKVQGSQLTEVSREFSLQGIPTPQIQAVSGLTGAGSATSTGSTTTTVAPAGTTMVTQTGTTDTAQTGSNQSETRTTPSVTPVVPAGQAVTPAPSAFGGLQYSLSPGDLLSEQVNLMYQIFNIRMLLDRALGDRLLWDGTSERGKARLQAVLGTNIWLDPPRDAVDAAAVVEVTLTLRTPAPNGQVPTLVAMMPQERTYNSAALSSKANAFGGAAVANVFTVGYSEKRRGQTFYLYRENDTVAFEKQADPGRPEKITFGWVFRPVLGRRSVMAGPRQMFAVVSLPFDDGSKQTQGRISLDASVRAYWRKYDPNTLTTAQRDEVRPWARLGHVFSLGTSLNFPPHGETEVNGYTVEVPLTRSLAVDLKPEIENVVWRPVGTKLAVVAVRGRNLFHDTRVVLGDRVLSTASDGLRLISDQALDVTTSIGSLFTNAAVLGRYGPAEPLEVICNAEVHRTSGCKPPLVRLSGSWNEPLAGVVEVTVTPSFRTPGRDDEECLLSEDLTDERLGQPVLFLDGVPVEGPYEFVPQRGDCQKDCLSIVAHVREGAAKKVSGMLSLKFPFRGSLFQTSQRIYDPRTAIRPRLLADNDYLFEQLNGPFGEPGSWRVVIPDSKQGPFILQETCDGDAVFCLPTRQDFFARFRPKSEPAVRGNVLLQARYGDEWASTYVIELPKGPQPPPKATVDKGQTTSVNQNDEVWRTFTGTGLTKAGAQLAAGRPLTVRPGEDGKTIEVLLSTDITRIPRGLDLNIVDAANQLIGMVHVDVKPVNEGKEAHK
jgi:hypothetical protein